MKLLLTAINAKYIHSNLAVHSLRAYAREYARAFAHEVEICEFTINHSINDILAGIYRAKPDVLCFSCYIWNVEFVCELAEEYHKLCPTVPIWVGGPEVSYETETFLRENPSVTGVMIGEGEETFAELCAFYAAQGNAMSQIAGLAYRDGDVIRFTDQREPLDLDTIPFCYDSIQNFQNRIIYYESSRGCPFCCSYCLSSIDRVLRFRSVEKVKEELTFFLERGVAQVKFVDRTFNCKHAHAMEIWQFIREHDNGITNFHFEIAADLLTEDEIALLSTMRPGLVQLEIGVQSTYQPTIAEIHRNMNLDRLKDVVRSVQAAGNINQHLDLIAGLPYEDYDTFAKSFDEIYDLRPEQLQLGFLKVLKGSYIYEHVAEYGLSYRSHAPYEVLSTNWLPYEKLLAIRRVEEMVEVYYNSGQYDVTMKLLETQFPSAFLMYQTLGDYYDAQGYFAMSHARIRRAEILLEFAKAHTSIDLEVVREGLLFDLYLRENMKSRPSWADDPKEWREVTRAHCTNGTLAHVERFHYRFPSRNERLFAGVPTRTAEPVFVRFDYTNRDPIHHAARNEIIN